MTKSDCKVCSEFKTWAHDTKTKEHESEKPFPHKHTTKDNLDILPCPPDSAVLGSSTWTFLHTMASYYPDQPSTTEKEAATSLINSLSQLYPCSYCAKHMRQELVNNPARVSNRSELEQWMCELHNEVNERLGKSLFDCSRVRERWKDGPANGRSCT